MIVSVRSLAKARRWGFGGFAIAVVALAQLAVASAAALAASETVMGLRLERASTGAEALEIRGASVESEPARFAAVGNLSQIPCPGSYRYSLQSENQQTGALSSYTALVSLAPLPADGPPSCGAVPPPRPGTLRISLSGREETIDFGKAARLGSEGFFGTLTMGAQPECGQRYGLSVDVDVRGWDRSVRYRLEVARWTSEAQGLPLERDVCR